MYEQLCPHTNPQCSQKGTKFFSGNLIRGKGIRGIVIHGNLMLVLESTNFQKLKQYFSGTEIFINIGVYTIENIALDTVS